MFFVLGQTFRYAMFIYETCLQTRFRIMTLRMWECISIHETLDIPEFKSTREVEKSTPATSCSVKAKSLIDVAICLT